MKSLTQLKQEFQAANQEHQFALAAGEPARLTAALTNWRRTFNTFNRAKKKEFKKTFKFKYAGQKHED